ncbi:hypothetical protein CDD81_5084 [Ophiocordyceps australis]|uniref:Uncharacterized protein n=1 Tax=Ophiocordyceps australis TaxID=1399860 RepID=A0A2C5XQ66_9HYPO|nr:hypothetical protein CDD81_5084 [Ophiocordyceps australis]
MYSARVFQLLLAAVLVLWTRQSHAVPPPLPWNSRSNNLDAAGGRSDGHQESQSSGFGVFDLMWDRTGSRQSEIPELPSSNDDLRMSSLGASRPTNDLSEAQPQPDEPQSRGRGIYQRLGGRPKSQQLEIPELPPSDDDLRVLPLGASRPTHYLSEAQRQPDDPEPSGRGILHRIRDRFRSRQSDIPEPPPSETDLRVLPLGASRPTFDSSEAQHRPDDSQSSGRDILHRIKDRFRFRQSEIPELPSPETDFRDLPWETSRSTYDLSEARRRPDDPKPVVRVPPPYDVAAEEGMSPLLTGFKMLG